MAQISHVHMWIHVHTYVQMEPFSTYALESIKLPFKKLQIHHINKLGLRGFFPPPSFSCNLIFNWKMKSADSLPH